MILRLAVDLTKPTEERKDSSSGEAPLKDILPYLEPKAVTSGIEVGCIVEIVTGAFKGESSCHKRLRDQGRSQHGIGMNNQSNDPQDAWRPCPCHRAC